MALCRRCYDKHGPAIPEQICGRCGCNPIYYIEATESPTPSGQAEFDLLAAELADYKKLLKEILKFMVHKEVPTKHAINGYRTEYHRELEDLRNKIISVGS